VVPDETTKSVVREAVVSGPTEFCVLIDEEGQPQPKKGPGRVFPGPNDRFRETGSRNRVYDAYHIRNDRGLLLRVVANTISAEELKKQLPIGTNLDDSRRNFTKGDEIFVGGTDSYLVPSTAFEVIDPDTRQPHVGNDHSKVYVKAIGVDQKSGVYIANVSTGNVGLRRGETKLLLDPRKERHVWRRVPGKMWNLMIAAGEAHKKVADTQMVETPWALSVVIPNNEAVLITSKDGRRCVVGPCTELLGYEEWFEVLTLSRGRPKSDDRQLETCFLRVRGNRITDSVELETEDFANIVVELSYGVEFVGETDEDHVKWFDYKDYVMLLCANLRSRLRNAAKKIKLTDLYPVVADFVRDGILGKKTEGEHRSGLLFKENNMMVQEVEVLSIQIPDGSVAAGLEDANRKVVRLQIGDTALAAELNSEKKRDDIDAQKDALAKLKLDRQREVELRKIGDKKVVDLQRITDENEVAKTRDQLAHELKVAQAENDKLLNTAVEEMKSSIAAIVRIRTNADEKNSLEIRNMARMAVIEFRQALAKVQQLLLTATAAADVERLKAIQPKLVEAIEGLGDKQLATSLAEHLPGATGSLGLLLGQGGIKAIKKMVEGTPIEGAINALSDTASRVAQDTNKVAGPSDSEE
jgi:major vault protein